MSATIYDIPLASIDGKPTTLRTFEGKVLLVVNVASKCGLTPQYEGLEALYESRVPLGLEVLGFPANNFNGQEPGTNAEIQDFCSSTFGVKFPLFSKISVAGDDTHPLYRALTQAQPVAAADGPFRDRLKGFGIESNPAPGVLWNFEKFLVSRSATVVARFAPDVGAAAALVAAIDAEPAKSM